MTVQILAETMHKAMEFTTRTDGSEFLRVRDGSPEWIQEAVTYAHNGQSLDDWRYRLIRRVLSALSEMTDGVESMYVEPDFATHVLLDWVSSNTDRMARVDDYVEAYGYSDLTTVLQNAQTEEICEIASLLIDALTARADTSPE